MSQPDRDYHEGLDGLQADMARHQRRYAGVEVTAEANRKLAQETIERLEKQDAEAKPKPPPAAPEQPTHATQKHEIDGKVYTLDKAPDKTPMFRTATQFEHDVMRHAMPRLELLLTKMDSGPLGSPSWRDRTLAAMYFKVKSLEAIASKQIDIGTYYEQAYQLDLQELLDASSAAFGDWRKDAPSRVIVSG